MSVNPKFLTPEDAAKYLTVSLSSLAKWRMSGAGPRYVKVGGRRVAYAISDLDAYAASRVATSTSQYPTRRAG